MTMRSIISGVRRFTYCSYPLLAVLVGAVSLLTISCNSKNPVAPAATAMTLVSPLGGTSYSFTDTIIVKWTANPDSLGNQILQSFTREYSLDSGKTWIKMTANPASFIDPGNDTYQQTWIGFDSTQVDPVTYSPLTKNDFLNRGVLAHVISYPPKLITRQSGFIFFHN